MTEPHPRFAELRSELIRLGAVALGGVIACTWVAHSLTSKALGVALTANDKEVESHNGTIRRWESERGEREAKFATKADIAPLVTDYNERVGGAIAAGRFWTVIVIATGFALTAGFGLAHLPALGG